MNIPIENQRVKDVINYYCDGNELLFSKEIGISQPRINRLFSIDPRNNKYPLVSFEIIQAIINKFVNVNSEWLINGNGNMLKSDSYYTKNNSRVKEEHSPHIITVDPLQRDNIVLVPQKLKAGYLEGYNDPKFIESLPSYRMPGLNNGVFRMFEVEGNSMFPTIPNKSYVVGQFVENWITGIKDNQVYAIISNEVEDGLVKRCINRIKKYNNLICKSDNRRNFPVQNINPESIKEVWEIKLHLNFNLPDPSDLYDRMNDLEAETQEMKKIIMQISNNQRIK